MRILLDEAQLGWDEAWDLTQRTLAYTNHTLLPEALEKWPLRWFELHAAAAPRDHLRDQPALPRRRARAAFPATTAASQRMSLIEEGPEQARSAWPTWRSSARTAPTASPPSTPSSCARRRFSDLAEMFPERFNNKTNGVTPRRWLLLANPALSRAITDAIGDGWITDLDEICRGSSRSPTTPASATRSCEAKRDAKAQFADWLKSTSGADGRSGQHLRLPGQAHPRVQAAAAQRAAHRRALQPAAREPGPRHGAAHVLLRAARRRPPIASPSSSSSSSTTWPARSTATPPCAGGSRSCSCPEYCVSLAERLIPAADVSNQISTAGYEASGTSNMKFMMNGALTIGTRDGATIEMAQEAGEENFFLFGLTARAGRRQPRLVQPALALRERAGDARRARPDLHRPLQPRTSRGVFAPLRDTLLTDGDHYMHLADLTAYLEADRRALRAVRRSRGMGAQGDPQRRELGQVLQRPDHRAIRDRIWHAKPCPVA